MSASHYTTKPEMVLDTKYFMSQMSRENPKELIIADRNISRISGLTDVPVINKLNISFNRLLESLDGIEQLPQLKELWSFACSIRDLSGLPSLTKLEILFLQHNRINSIYGMFQTLNKLKELRLDHNRIAKIQSLQNCLTLRKLDLSHNLLESIDGLSGLQSLQELNLANNSINSISQLRGLPNLRELDVSHNHLKSLDGIQYALKLEVVKADHNHMVHLILSPYINNVVGSTAATAVASTVSTIGTANNKASSNTKKETSTTNKSRKSFSSISTNVAENNNKISTTAAIAAPALPTLDRPILTELYLSNNRIKSIGNLEQYAHCLNILDISNNQLIEVEKLMETLQACSELNELRIFNNPFTTTTAGSNSEQLKALGRNNSKLMIIAEVVSDVSSLLFDSPQPAKNNSRDGNNNKDSPSVASSQFHTWERGNDDNSIASASRGLFFRADSTNSKQGKEDTKEDSKVEEKIEEKVEEDEEEIIEKTINSMFITPMIVKDVLTQEQIDQRAQQFRHLLTTTKEELQASIFRFALPENEEGESKPVNPYEKHMPRTAMLSVEKQQALSEKLITALDKALDKALEAPPAVTQPVIQPVVVVQTTTEKNDSKNKKSMMFSPSNSDIQLQPLTTTTATTANAKSNSSKPPKPSKEEKDRKESKENNSDLLSPVSSKSSIFSSKLHSHINSHGNSQPHLETGLNTHGHKAFVSKVESEALQQAHAELASLLHGSTVTVNDTDFSEIKITKVKKQANRFFLTPTGEQDGESFDVAEAIEVSALPPAENPLMMSIEDRSYLQHLLTPRPNEPSAAPAMTSTQHAVVYKPNSIGYDRRLVDDDDATVGSVPLQLTASEAIPSPSSRVVRAHSAPSIRPLTSSASRPQSSHGFGITADEEGAEAKGKKDKKSIVVASANEGHSSSASTILR